MEKFILDLLYGGKNPYSEFSRRDIRSRADNFYWRHIREVVFWSQPILTLEVGTGDGNSSIETINHINHRKFPNKSYVIVADSFANYLDVDFSKKYDEFLSYCSVLGKQSQIFPFVASGTESFLFFKEKKVEFDLIKLNGFYQLFDFERNLAGHYDNLRDCGIIYGDNYVEGNHIYNCVKNFSSKNKTSLIEDRANGHWIIAKNANFEQRETE